MIPLGSMLILISTVCINITLLAIFKGQGYLANKDIVKAIFYGLIPILNIGFTIAVLIVWTPPVGWWNKKVIK